MRRSEQVAISKQYAMAFPLPEEQFEKARNADRLLGWAALHYGEEVAGKMGEARAEIEKRHLSQGQPITDWQAFAQEVLALSGVTLPGQQSTSEGGSS